MTAADIVTAACKDAMVLGVGEVLAGDISDDVLAKLNRILDNWNADQRFCYAERFDQFTITPNHNPHTLGPSGADFTYAVRPVNLDAASVVDTSVSPNVQIQIRLKDWQWYSRQSVPGVTATYEVAAYYQPDWPNGSLYLWPIPTTAYKIELWTKTLLAQLKLTDTFSLPPGYWDAITLTLAEDIAPMYEQTPNPFLIQKAADARRRVFGNNVVIPKLATRDSGMPSGPAGSRWNYQTGMWNR